MIQLSKIILGVSVEIALREKAITEHNDFHGPSGQKQGLPDEPLSVPASSPFQHATDPTNNTNARSVVDKEESRQYNTNKLLNIHGFNEIFELVRQAVEQEYKLHRAGLSLVLQGLPSNLGAYHVLGSNVIIVNKRILSLIKGIKTHEQYNAFLFTVLTHEYLHTFGITNEFRVRSMTCQICSSFLGEEHPATIMARYEPWSVFPELYALQNNFDHKFEIIKEFDRKSQSYIS